MTKKKAKKKVAKKASLTPYSQYARQVHGKLQEGFRALCRSQKIGMMLGLSVKGEVGRYVTATYSFRWSGIPDGANESDAIDLLVRLMETVAGGLAELPAVTVDWKDVEKHTVAVRMNW